MSNNIRAIPSGSPWSACACMMNNTGDAVSILAADHKYFSIEKSICVVTKFKYLSNKIFLTVYDRFPAGSVGTNYRLQYPGLNKSSTLDECGIDNFFELCSKSYDEIKSIINTNPTEIINPNVSQNEENIAEFHSTTTYRVPSSDIMVFIGVK